MAGTGACPDCGQQVSKLVRTCPHCGRVMQYEDLLTPKQKVAQRKGCWMIIAIFMGFVLLSLLMRACGRG